MIWICSSLIFFLSVTVPGRGAPENMVTEFEAKSGRDGAWLVFLVIDVSEL